MSASRGIRVILAGLLLAAPLTAQVPDSVLYRRVRVTTTATSDAQTTGVLSALDAETLQLERDGETPVTIALGDVRKVEVWNGTAHSAGTGAVVGMSLGAAAGIAGMLVFCHEFGGSNCGSGEAAESAMLGGLAGAAGGAVLGALIGAAIPHTKWQNVQVRPALARGAPGLALRLEF